MGSARRVRSAGAGRPARRGVSRGGTGVAADLNVIFQNHSPSR
jgi:hypothetical protein